MSRRLLPKWAKVGTSFEVKFGNSNDTLWHIRGIVDDMAVCRRWNASKKRWEYEVQNEAFFQAYADFIAIRRHKP